VSKFLTERRRIVEKHQLEASNIKDMMFAMQVGQVNCFGGLLLLFIALPIPFVGWVVGWLVGRVGSGRLLLN
jgi:hypothetical protein